MPLRTFLVLLMIICGSASFAAPTSPNAATQARDAIQEASLRALTALQDVDMDAYFALLHPDYQSIDARGGKSGRAQVKQKMLALLQSRRLGEARSTIGGVKLTRSSGAPTAIVSGEERLVWHPLETPDEAAPGTPPTPKKERLAVTTRYQRVWIKGKQGWLLLRSRTLSEKSASIP